MFRASENSQSMFVAARFDADREGLGWSRTRGILR